MIRLSSEFKCWWLETSIINFPISLFSWVQSLSCVQLLPPHGLQHARLPCSSPAPGTCSNSCPSSQWCHPAISSSAIPFSSCLQSFPASRSFPMSQFFAWGGQSIGVSVSTSVLPMNIQDWFPLGWTGWIFSLSKALSRVFCNTTVQKHQFFGGQFSFLNSLIAQSVKNLPAMQEALVRFLSLEDPLEKVKATHFSILWVPWWLRP